MRPPSSRPSGALARLLACLLLGTVVLDDGTTAVGFACDAVAAANGTDITHVGDWLAAPAPGESPATTAGRRAPGPVREFIVTALSRGSHAGTRRP